MRVLRAAACACVVPSFLLSSDILYTIILDYIYNNSMVYYRLIEDFLGDATRNKQSFN